jgi:hypothetical protein
MDKTLPHHPLDHLQLPARPYVDGPDAAETDRLGLAMPKVAGVRKWLRRLSPGWLAVVISVCALGVSLYNAYLDRQYKRLSARPHLEMGFRTTQNGAGWTLGNFGLGPAVVQWFAAYIDDKYQIYWSDIEKLLGGPGGPFEHGAVDPGQSLLPGPIPGKIFWVSPPERAEIIARNYHRVRLEICYCSIYDECWRATNAVRSHEQVDCRGADPKPKTSAPPVLAPAPGQR